VIAKDLNVDKTPVNCAKLSNISDLQSLDQKGKYYYSGVKHTQNSSHRISSSA